ncbi:hypothetical protein [Deinococcus aestuarii]|uniref:hypothetical protein n=1 Tax=Deinococcus aestuarii TaxID=2774531 RepID=UPI001C0C16D9|nr:hypothetical protein [Deinococcus aestuarii]
MVSSKPLSPVLPDPTPQLAALQARLREHAVWWAEGNETPEPGEWGFERFLAVVEDAEVLTRWAQQAREIEQAYRDAELLRAPERRMPSFFDEVWDHCALHVNQAWESHRVREHSFPLEGLASAADWPALQARLTVEHGALIARLQALDLRTAEVRGVQQLPGGPVSPVLHLEARRGRRFTVRRRTGDAYRLHASTVGGEIRKNVRVGVVVVRGLLGEVQTVHPRRTPRKDRLPPGVQVGKFEVAVEP